MLSLRIISSTLILRAVKETCQDDRGELLSAPFFFLKWVKFVFVIGSRYWQLADLGWEGVRSLKQSFVRIHCQYRFMKKLNFYYGISLNN